MLTAWVVSLKANRVLGNVKAIPGKAYLDRALGAELDGDAEVVAACSRMGQRMLQEWGGLGCDVSERMAGPAELCYDSTGLQSAILSETSHAHRYTYQSPS